MFDYNLTTHLHSINYEPLRRALYTMYRTFRKPEEGVSLNIQNNVIIQCMQSHSSRHVWTLGKSLTRSCLWPFGVKLRHSLSGVLGAPPSSNGFGEVL